MSEDIRFLIGGNGQNKVYFRADKANRPRHDRRLPPAPAKR